MLKKFLLVKFSKSLNLFGQKPPKKYVMFFWVLSYGIPLVCNILCMHEEASWPGASWLIRVIMTDSSLSTKLYIFCFVCDYNNVRYSFHFVKQHNMALQQSVVNNFSDGRIQIWILFAKDIFYEYEYEYYSWHLVSRIWIRILFVKNIHKYIWIFKYIRIFENHQTSGYCCLPDWRLWIW